MVATANFDVSLFLAGWCTHVGGSQACFPDVLNSQLKGLAFYINKFFSSSLALTKWRCELDLTLTHDILSSQCAIQSKSWIIISQGKDV